MFFDPPKVKSLSRYAEYGAYLGNRHFLAMLAIAFTVHMAIIVIYSMTPSEHVMRIPVRAINIKLSGGSTGNGIHMPVTSSMPEIKPLSPSSLTPSDTPAREESPKPLHPKNTEPPVNKEIKQIQPKTELHHESVPVPLTSGKTVVSDKKNRPVFTFPTPKKYVRESEPAASAPTAQQAGSKASGGNGSNITGDVGGQEVVSRYSQIVSQWIKNHQDYARAAYAEAVQGQGSLTGQTVIRLRISRDGHILFSGVDRTSGNELVDAAAIAMVHASDPLPAVPSNYPSDSQLEFLIAVQVDLSKH